MKRVLSFLLSTALLLTALPLSFVTAGGGWGSAGSEGYYEYYVVSGELSITGVDPTISGDIVIPSTLGGWEVKYLSYEAFEGCTAITAVTIPETVTDMGARTFYGCTSLVTVTIPNSVTDIGASVFEGCTALTTIDIPNSVTDIGASAFRGCTALTAITVPDSVTSIGNYAFRDCTALASITIPDSVTSIGEAFGETAYCNDPTNWENGVLYIGNHLIDVKSTISGHYDIKDGTKTIAGGTFSYWCKSLTSVSIPGSVASIGDDAFIRCDSLASVTISEGVESIGSRAFYGCSSLTEISIPASVTSIGQQAFQDCTTLATVTLPGGLTSLESSTFRGCASLTSVTIPDGVQIIEWSAFENCTSLTTVTIGSGVRDIYSEAFFGCTSLTAITIGKNLTEIDGTVFSGCTALSSIVVEEGNPVYHSAGNCVVDTANRQVVFGCRTSVIPNDGSVTSIGDSAFEGCAALAAIVIPNSVTSIGDSAFAGCTALTAITISDSVTSIGHGAFSNTGFYNDTANWEGDVLYIGKHLIKANYISGDYIVKEGTKTVAASAFFYCGDLISVTLPASLISIGDDAFGMCTSLTAVTIPEGVTSIGGWAFYNTGYYNDPANWQNGVLYIGNHLIEAEYTLSGDYTVKAGTKTIAPRAFYECSNLTSVTIPNGVVSIEDYVFSYCESLTAVSIPMSVTSIGYRAFYECDALTAVTIPEGVTSIGDEAFYSCYALTAVVIPAGVTSIGWGAFEDCTSLVSVTIPEGVESIGDSAFEDCYSLTTVTIPASVTSIGDDAFGGCGALASIEVQSGNPVYHSAGNCLIETASKTLILGCNTGVIPTDGSVTSIGEGAFYGCDSLTAVTIPASVTSIGYRAFYGCSALASVEVQNGNTVYHSAGNCLIETASKTLILGCNTATIPDDGSITSIGEGAFYDCDTLTAVILPASVLSIGECAFYSCGALIDVYYGGSKDDRAKINIGSSNYSLTDAVWHYNSGACVHSFADANDTVCDLCGYDKTTAYYTYTVSDGTATITDVHYSIRGDVVIPSTLDGYPVTSIGGNAFLYCRALTAVTIPASVTSIGENAFLYCSALAAVTIPASVTSIGDWAFYGCSALAAVTIPNGVASIGKAAFYGCSALAAVTIPASVTSIGGRAFGGCGALASIEVQSGNPVYHSAGNCLIETASKTLILGCNTATIPDDGSVTSIGGGAFYGCDSLTAVTIPASVTSIGYGAFYGCSALASVEVQNGNPVYHSAGNCLIETASKTLILGCNAGTIPDDGSVTSIGEGAFYGCDSLTAVTIPQSVTRIGEYAFYDCDLLTSVTVPASVTDIGENAFNWCTSLTDVYYDGSEADRANIVINSGNTYLTDATWHYTCKHKNTTASGYVAPSCTADGYTGDTVCADCGETVTAGEKISALDHVYDNACDATCNVCGFKREVAVLIGDVDGGGKVDSTDARLVLQYAVKKIEATALDTTVADVDGNGKVDSTDARLILQYAVRKITNFPASA